MFPAARLGDNHICPLINGQQQPHLGGPILGPGTPNVIIEGKPAACIGDTMSCIGQFDVITSGSSSVFVCGKSLARKGDSTLHGGMITSGSLTVLIGG